MKSREDVLRLIEQNQVALKKLGVRRLGLFGSCARCEATAESDPRFCRRVFRQVLRRLHGSQEFSRRPVPVSRGLGHGQLDQAATPADHSTLNRLCLRLAA